MGVVPHILVCLDSISDRATASKSKALKQLMDGRRDLDEINDRITNFNSVLKECRLLKEALAPDLFSEVLKAKPCESEDLRNMVVKIQSLAKQIGGPGEVGDDLNLAVKAIVCEALPPSLRRQKPSLNTDDLDDSYGF